MRPVEAARGRIHCPSRPELARRAGARAPLLAVFRYSGLYHETVSVLARSGYGGPTADFLVQYLGVVAESIGPGRRALRGRRGWAAPGPWLWSWHRSDGCIAASSRATWCRC